MEILNKISEETSKRCKYEHLCGLDLTDFQINVLLEERNEDYLTEFPIQYRQAGTTTALLLRLYKDIFIDGNKGGNIVICRNLFQASVLKDMFLDLLKKDNKESMLTRNNKHLIEIEKNTRIRFTNNNPINLIGVSNQTFYVNDYNDNTELLNVLRCSIPGYIYLFREGTERRN